MAITSSTLFGKKRPELGDKSVHNISDTTAADHSPNSSPPGDDSMQPYKKSLKEPMYEFDMRSPILEDGLASYDNLPSLTNTDFVNDPFSLTGTNYPIFKPGRSRLSSDWLQILQEGNKRYALRDTDRNTFRGSGWIDKDKSGDFNPDEKAERFAKPQRSRIRKTSKSSDLEDGNHWEQKPKFYQPKTLSYEQGRKNGRSMILRLNFSSEPGIEKFKALTKDFPPTAGDAASQGLSDSAYGSSKLPFKDRNGATTRRSAQNVNERIHDHPYQNSEDTYEKLSGHREARSCKDCYDIGLECSLIDNYLSYPCDNCEEDNLDCILITPPKEKRVCEHCKRKRLQCSYNHDDEGDSIITACDNCQAANVTCIAGLAKSYRMDDVLASAEGKRATLKAAPQTRNSVCIECCKNKVRISIGSTSQNRVCGQCLTSKPSVNPESSPASDTSVKKPGARSKVLPKKGAATRKAQLFTSSKSSTIQGKRSKQPKKVEKPQRKKTNFKFGFDDEPAKPKFSASVSGGKVMKITTSFCHPIQFNWEPPPPLPQSPYSLPKSLSEIQASSFPCHFCTNPGLSYAIGGLGDRIVEVIQWSHDIAFGYEELEGGWSEEGQEQTRMCHYCTTERMLICICPDHMIRPIKGLDPRTFDFDSAFQGLLNQLLNLRTSEDGITADTLEDVMDVKWCSICPHPAFFECCVRPPCTKFGIETLPTDDIGCGLLLCEVCAFRMTGRRQHDRVPTPSQPHPDHGDVATINTREEPIKTIMTLDEHINAASKDMFHYNDGVRADACFLKADGELMRRQSAGSEAAAGDVGDEGKEVVDDESECDELQDRAFKKCKWGMGSPIDLTR